MIEVWLILTSWCNPDVPECLLDKDVADIYVGSSVICKKMKETLPAQYMQAVPGLIAVARCEKRRRAKKEEK